MPFKTPINSPLTEIQSKALSKVNSLRTYVALPKFQFPTLDESQQISTFDYSLRLLDSIAGDNAGDKVFNKFMNKIFAVTGPDSIVLEEMIVKGLGDSLEARGIFLAPSGSTSSEDSSSTSGSTSGSTSTSGATTSGITQTNENFRQFEVLEYKFFLERKPAESEGVEKNLVTYNYVPGIEEDENGVRTGYVEIYIYSTYGDSDIDDSDKFPSFIRNFDVVSTDGLDDIDPAISLLEIEAKNSGFIENGISYPKEGEEISSTNNATSNENLVVTVKNNYDSVFPDFEVIFTPAEIPSGTLTDEEVISTMQLEANEVGFTHEGLTYPKTSTEISTISLPFGNLVGKVIDKENGPIPGAYIEVLGAEPRVIVATDGDGNYAIKDLASSKYNIKASYSLDAFEEKVEELFTISGGKDNVLDFQLEDKDLITVTASTASTESTSSTASNEEVDALMSGSTVSGSPSFTYSYYSEIKDGPIGLEIETTIFPSINGKSTSFDSDEEYPPFTRSTTLEGPSGYRTVAQVERELKEQSQQEGFTPENGIVYPKESTVAYYYTITGEPIGYYFSKKLGGNTEIDESSIENFNNSIEANEEDGSLTLTLSVENNNPNLPSFERLFVLEPDEAIDSLSDLEYDAEDYKEVLTNYGDEIVIDQSTGLVKQYPKVSEYTEFNVRNNIALPNFTASTRNDQTLKEAYEQVKYQHGVPFEIDGVEYPAAGTTITEQVTVDSNGNEVINLIIGEIPSTEEGSIEESEVLEDIPVGNLDVPRSTSFGGELGAIFQEVGQGISEDISNTLSSILAVNPLDIGLTNIQYLNKYLLPELILGKRELVKQIMTMLFGPKELMSEDPETQEKLLNSAACGESMFSVTNNPSETDKQLEFNRVELKEQLKKGKIELFISCQKVEISLPENFIEEFDLVPSEISGIPEADRPNPATSFTLLSNFMQNEVQAQRNAADGNQVKKSFFQILMDKILQYISVAFSVNPLIGEVFSFINRELSKTGQPNVNPSEILSSPCEITSACKSEDKEEFKKKSAFSQSLIDSLYALVLSMLLEKLLSEIKPKIKKLIQEKALEKIIKLRKRMLERFNKLENYQT